MGFIQFPDVTGFAPGLADICDGKSKVYGHPRAGLSLSRQAVLYHFREELSDVTHFVNPFENVESGFLNRQCGFVDGQGVFSNGRP